MIHKYTVIIRLTGVAGSKHPAGKMFATVKKHETRAYYTDTQALAQGFFVIASPLEVKAFHKGATMVDLDNRKFTDKEEISNVIALKAKIAAGKAGGDISDAGKTGKRKYYKWTSSDVNIVMGTIRGSYDINNNYVNKKVIWSLAKQLNMTEKKLMKSFKELLNPTSKVLKKYNMSQHDFDNIKPIKSKYSTISFDLFMVTSTVLSHEKALKKSLRVFRDMGDDGKTAIPSYKGGSIAGRKLKRWTPKELNTLVAIYKGGKELKERVKVIFEKAACFVDHSAISCAEKYHKIIKDSHKDNNLKPIYITDNLVKVMDINELDITNGVFIKGAGPVINAPKPINAPDSKKGLIDVLYDKINKDRYRTDENDMITDHEPVEKDEGIEAIMERIDKRYEAVEKEKEDKLMAAKIEQSVIVQAILLLTTKLNNAEKLQVVDHLFD